MPWKEANKMSLRHDFVLRALGPAPDGGQRRALGSNHHKDLGSGRRHQASRQEASKDLSGQEADSHRRAQQPALDH
jgi:hypothetical protein